MKKIEKNNLQQEIKNLKKGETLIIQIKEDICNILNMLNFQCQSLENLFMSYINKTIDKADAEILTRFLNEYTDKFIEKEMFIKNTLIDLLGQDIYELITRRIIKFNINDVTNTIQLFK
ncbi:hypothetical protein [Clostridium sporogenes]|uniref:hypothetical protein n=1 Tax=Clostridium sporogenes TaxID=1509 RepID=UPI00223716A5|nr:hypothetical protein [Clostridium sporogenes]MCW6088806.1 hypothetical protein [Clostridium sporogenes]